MTGDRKVGDQIGDRLQAIIEHKRAEIAKKEGQHSTLRERAEKQGPPCRGRIGFKKALNGPGLGLIAEIKRASPSAGKLAGGVDPARRARHYAEGGACACSVLTDRRHFGGSLEDLQKVREAVELPLLRKDFIIHPLQIYEAVLAGADAVLLMASVLSDNELENLFGLACSFGLEGLLEVHSGFELERVLKLGERCFPDRVLVIGINNRNLKDFTVDLEVTRRLFPEVPNCHLVVSESGIHHPDQIAELKQLGVDAVLIGEALMAGSSIRERIADLYSAVGGIEH